MPRIPDSELQRLKDEVSVQRLVESSGVELKRVGKDWAGRCPLHADDTASLIVTPAKNLWHCFGCGAGGGPIDWVMKLRGLSFRHALELLKDETALASFASSAAGQSVKRATVRALSAPVSLDADDHALLRQVIDYYHQSLKDAPEALEYLRARGLEHPELIEHFRLGYANRTLGLRLPQKTRVTGAQMRGALQRIGILRASGHEHFNGSLIVPIFDEAGQVTEIYGRKINDKLHADIPKHLYLPGHAERGRGIFNEAALPSHPEIILCEALIDALTFWCAGYRNVTSAYGVEGFTDDMLAAFKRHGTRRVLIAFDRDEAGERGAAKVAQRLMGEGIECWRIQWPKGMDANEYALKVQPASKSLGLLIRKAQWLGQGAQPQRAQILPAPAKLQNQSALSARQTSAASSLADSKQEETAPAAATVAAQPATSSLAADPVPLPASPMPEALADCQVERIGQDVHIRLGEGGKTRCWRVRGLHKNLGPDVLKVNLRVSAGEGGAFHVDTLDLYQAKARAHYIAQAALETAVDERTLKSDLGRVLLQLELLQDEAIAQTLAPQPEPQMDAAEQAAALAWLQAPDLPGRIVADFAACGMVGEAGNALVGYLAALSRKLPRPLAVVIQSSSAAGKSSLMDAILAFVPEDERVHYSAMTGQSLFYMGQGSLKHKILAIAEQEGAQRASYALKLLQSEGQLTIASTGADPHTGNLVTQEYHVEGPMSLFMTTTAIDIDEELMNRCLVLSVNEEREQTRAIHQRQRQRHTLAGLRARHDSQALIALHRNAQRLLRPLAVVNPWAEQLTFLDEHTRTRRDHEKYLTLIDAIALLHQRQRPTHTASIAGQEVPYVEATLDDIALANRIAHEVLGTSLDELPPQTRRVLACVQTLVKTQMAQERQAQREVRFSRWQVRQAAGLSDTQARVHLERLTALEYLLVHRGQRGQSYEYELLHDGQDAGQGPHLSGLIDVDSLRAASGADTATAAGSRGEQSQIAPPSRAQRGVNAPLSRMAEPAASPHESLMMDSLAAVAAV